MRNVLVVLLLGACARPAPRDAPPTIPERTHPPDTAPVPQWVRLPGLPATDCGGSTRAATTAAASTDRVAVRALAATRDGRVAAHVCVHGPDVYVLNAARFELAPDVPRFTAAAAVGDELWLATGDQLARQDKIVRVDASAAVVGTISVNCHVNAILGDLVATTCGVLELRANQIHGAVPPPEPTLATAVTNRLAPREVDPELAATHLFLWDGAVHVRRCDGRVWRLADDRNSERRVSALDVTFALRSDCRTNDGIAYVPTPRDLIVGVTNSRAIPAPGLYRLVGDRLVEDASFAIRANGPSVRWAGAFRDGVAVLYGNDLEERFHAGAWGHLVPLPSLPSRAQVVASTTEHLYVAVDDGVVRY